MIDIKYITENIDTVKQNVKNRNINVDIDKLIILYEQVKEFKGELDNLRSERNLIARQVKSATTDERISLANRSKELKQLLSDKDGKLKKIEGNYTSELLKVPNRSHPDVPIGFSEEKNKEIFRFKEPTVFSFRPKDHVELGIQLDLIDFESGAKVSGSKQYFLKNEAVLLEYALTKYAMDFLIKKGFTLVSTPDLAKIEILEGIGFNPRGSETQVYKIENSDLCLIGTSEITLGGMLSNTVLNQKDLPLKLAGISHCFRTEAGAYGRFSKGLYRVHQFTKIEMFAFALPEKSDEMHEYFRSLEEELFKSLDIPFRTVDICTGDLGNPAYRKYDIEAWMPGRHNEDENTIGNWGEVTSTSNCTDYQSRRLNIKFKSETTGRNEYVHMLNGTAFALSRTLLAILENYQQSDGSINMPKVLVPYLGFDSIKR